MGKAKVETSHLRSRAIRSSAIALILAAGCSYYARQADKTAYKKLEHGQETSLGQTKPFDVIYHPLAVEPGKGTPGVRIGSKTIPIGDGETQHLTLAECLEIAACNSRDLQNQKESLYTSALAAANATRSWLSPLLGGTLTGQAANTRSSTGETTTSGSGEGQLTLTQRFITGGVVTLAAASSFATDWVGSRSTSVGSLVEASVTQPLLKGAWQATAYEPVYRQERDFLISVFSYERFRQTLATGIASTYYSVLSQRDQIENERANIVRLKQTFALTKVLVEGGQASPIEQDQAEQDLLNALVRLQSAEQAYRDALDAFKISLGLPLLANVEVNYPGELDRIMKDGPRSIPFQEPEAIEIALGARPDVLTAMAQMHNAERDIAIAADNFLPQLDFTVAAGAVGAGNLNSPATGPNGTTRNASVAFHYDVDQTNNRDAYRNALIALEKAKRDLDALEDSVRQDVRGACRSLRQTRESYNLQVRSVEVATRRRKLAVLQQKEGQASARDVLEAEEALRQAQNGLTTALLTYTATRLQFLARLGMVRVDEKGMIRESSEPSRFQRLEERYRYLTTRG